MKANEFVRVFGLDIAKIAINECPPEYSLDIIELKRLVESHEFVSANGGVEGAMKYINNHDPNATSKHYNALRTKVSDVESCQ